MFDICANLRDSRGVFLWGSKVAVYNWIICWLNVLISQQPHLFSPHWTRLCLHKLIQGDQFQWMNADLPKFTPPPHLSSLVGLWWYCSCKCAFGRVPFGSFCGVWHGDMWLFPSSSFGIGGRTCWRQVCNGCQAHLCHEHRDEPRCWNRVSSALDSPMCSLPTTC